MRLGNKLNENPDVVTESISELGQTNLVETEPGGGPVRNRPYNIAHGISSRSQSATR